MTIQWMGHVGGVGLDDVQVDISILPAHRELFSELGQRPDPLHGFQCAEAGSQALGHIRELSPRSDRGVDHGVNSDGGDGNEVAAWWPGETGRD